MRILLTVHQFLPDHSTGTEILTCQIAAELARRGHDLRIVTGFPMKRPPPGGRIFDQYEYLGLQVHRYYHQEGAAVGAQTNIAELEYNNCIFADWFRHFLNHWRPHVVHFFHLKNLSISAIDVCREAGISTVFTATDFWLVCPTTQLLLPDDALCQGPDVRGVNCLRHAIANTQPAPVKRLAGRLPDTLMAAAIRLAHVAPFSTWQPFSWARSLQGRPAFIRERAASLDCLLVPTRLMEETLRRNGICPKRTIVTRFGIDTASLRREVSQPTADVGIRVGFIGSLSHWKGAHVLLQAVRLLPTDLCINVQVFGSPTVYPEYAKALIESAHGDERVRFCGTFSNEGIGDVFANIDVLVVPSLWYENTPLVILSAQAAGCPVVASNLGGMAEVIRDGIDGILFPPGDAKALARIIRSLSDDRESVRRLAEGSTTPKTTSEYSTEILNIYRELLGEEETGL